MEEIDIKICLKKIKKDLGNTKKIIIMQKNQNNFFPLFFLHCIKIKRTLAFGEKYINKNKFHMQKKPS